MVLDPGVHLVKRGQKLMVEKFVGGGEGGGASLVLFPHLTQCLQIPRGVKILA